jgi:hypothetical protein
MDASRVRRIREDMERAEARRLQPHYIESFFLGAFQRLGGSAKQSEPRRCEVSTARSAADCIRLSRHPLLDSVLDLTLERNADLSQTRRRAGG